MDENGHDLFQSFSCAASLGWMLSRSALNCEVCDVCVSHFVSRICSSSWAFLHSSSAGGKLFPTFMKSAATLLLRRKPAARRFSPCRTQASTAAVLRNKRSESSKTYHVNHVKHVKTTVSVGLFLIHCVVYFD